MGLIESRVTPAVAGFMALVVGFMIADLTDIRWLGGLFMILIGSVGAVVMYQRAGLPRTLAALGIVVVAFVISHPLGAVFGSYGSLLIVAALAALFVYLITPRRGSA
jgi:hypothetical protein